MILAPLFLYLQYIQVVDTDQVIKAVLEPFRKEMTSSHIN